MLCCGVDVSGLGCQRILVCVGRVANDLSPMCVCAFVYGCVWCVRLCTCVVLFVYVRVYVCGCVCDCVCCECWCVCQCVLVCVCGLGSSWCACM